MLYIIQAGNALQKLSGRSELAGRALQRGYFGKMRDAEMAGLFPRLHTRVKKGQKHPDPAPESPTNPARLVCLPPKPPGAAAERLFML